MLIKRIVFDGGLTMGDLNSFAHEVESRVRRAQSEPKWEDPDIRQYMTGFDDRRTRFDEQSAHLVLSVIRPRLEKVTACLSNSSPEVEVKGSGSCLARFGFCERFPVNAEVQFRIDHDVTWSRVYVQYELCISPALLKANASDRLTLPLEGVMPSIDSGSVEAHLGPVGKVDQLVEQWVEKRLLEFVDSYLLHDRGSELFSEDTSTDPVCGMRLMRTQSIKNDYQGHQYFFCSPECAAAFLAEPEKFTKFTSVQDW